MVKEENSGHTLHRRIVNDIEGRILSGEWQPGYHLPFEIELAAQYGCSRMTVNKVLTQLAKSGLVERRRKSGTFVRRPQSQSAVLEIRDIREEVASLDLEYGYRLVSNVRRLSILGDQRRLGISGSTEVLDLTCVHYASDQPFCLERRLIDLSVVPSAATVDFSDFPPGRWLVLEVPWSRAVHGIGALPADGEQAGYLGLKVGHACLEIERQTWSGQGSGTHVRLIYPFEVHRLRAEFSPVSGG